MSEESPWKNGNGGFNPWTHAFLKERVQKKLCVCTKLQNTLLFFVSAVASFGRDPLKIKVKWDLLVPLSVFWYAIPIFQWRVLWPNKLYLPFRAQLRKNHILDGCSWHQCREVKKVGSEFCRLFNGFDSYSTVCIAGANEIISRNCFKSWKSQVCIFPLR